MNNKLVWMARAESKALCVVTQVNGKLAFAMIRNSEGKCNFRFKKEAVENVEVAKFVVNNLFNYSTDIAYGLEKGDFVLKSTQPNLIERKGLIEIPFEKVEEFLKKEGFDLSKLKVNKGVGEVEIQQKSVESPLNYEYERCEDYDVSAFASLKCQRPFLENIYENKVTNAVLLIGAPGTGKSTEFKIYAAQNNIPFYQMQLNAQSLSFDLLSEFIPNTEDASSPAKLKRSPFTNAYEFGGICQIDEINMASAGALAALNSALDDTAQITLSDGRVIKRHKNFFLVATMNPLLEGTKALNQATLNRFFTYYWDEDGREDLVKKLSVKVSPKAAGPLADLHMNVKKYLKDAGISVDMTMRNAVQFAQAFSVSTEREDREMAFVCAYVTPIISDIRDMAEFNQYRLGLMEIFKRSTFGIGSRMPVEDELN